MAVRDSGGMNRESAKRAKVYQSCAKVLFAISKFLRVLRRFAVKKSRS
jgi:hypothetical protein